MLVSLNFWLLIVALVSLVRSNDTQQQQQLGIPIEGRLMFPGGFGYTSNCELTLNGMQYTTMAAADGSFIFHDVPSGIYLLDVTSHREYWPQMKLKVFSEEGTVNVVEYKYPGAKRFPTEYPILIKPLAPVHFFQKAKSFSIIGMIMGNPMILMMGFSLVMVMGLPALLKSIPPEELEEMTKGQGAGQGDPMKMIQELMGGKQAAADPDDDE